MPKGIPKDNSLKHTLLHRLKITRGHLNKVIKMVENDDYCIDVIHQTIAIQNAISSINREILKNHLKTCVSAEIKKGNTEEVISEVLKVMEKQ